MLRRIELTPANIPVLVQPEEKILQIQDNTGLYDGKYKIPEYQNGCAYLTTHRFCYVDNANPKTHAVALEVKDVVRVDFYGGFMRSSPKITLRLNNSPPDSPAVGPSGSARTSQLIVESSRSSTPKPHVTWICPICTFSNPVPDSYTPGVTPASSIPPCGTCGIKPQASVLDKAVLDRISTLSLSNDSGSSSPIRSSNPDSNVCPRCTFHNHPSISQCEMCGEPLAVAPPSRGLADSPAPVSASAKINVPIEVVKISFRQGGAQEFHQKLKEAMVQKKWLLKDAPPVPKASTGRVEKETYSGAGIIGLERRGVTVRKQNEAVMSTAFEDLEALMAAAKDMIKLSEQFAQSFPESASTALSLSSTALSLMTGVTDSSSSSYHISLARQIADFLLAPVAGSRPPRSLLASQGGTLTLVDLYATFNRARGFDLISPQDLSKATELFSSLHLPVRLKAFRKSGLTVVQDAEETEEKIERRILGILRDGSKWGRGVGVKEVAERFGWSLGVAMEELEMCEERGGLCREGGVEGVRFWENHLLSAKARSLMGPQVGVKS